MYIIFLGWRNCEFTSSYTSQESLGKRIHTPQKAGAKIGIKEDGIT